jgi:uncharacterized protein (TIGR03089 family)
VPTIAQLFAESVAIDPARPLLTWYDDATGERTELSGATLDNWVSKTGNLLVHGLGLGPGDTASVVLPPHWQTAAIMLGCWTAGLAIVHSDSPTDVSFGLVDGPAPGGEAFAVGLHPFALPIRDLPDGVQDWVLAARTHGDRYAGMPADPAAAALIGLPGGGSVSHAELAGSALARADELGVSRGDRVIINVDAHRRPMDWLVAPIAAGASLVLCRNTAADRLEPRAATERATARLL